MLQRLRLQVGQFYETHLITPHIALVIGILLLVAHALVAEAPSSDLETAGIRFALALPFLIVGGLGILAERFFRRESLPTWTYLALSVALGIGLFSLPEEGLWSLWMSMIAFSLIPALPGLSREPLEDRFRLTYTGIVLLAALLGVLRLATLQGQEDVVLLGIGILLVGHALCLLVIPTSAAKSSGGTRPATLPSRKQAGELDVALLDPEALADLSIRIHVAVEGMISAAQEINAVTTQQTSNADEQIDFIKNTNQRMDDFLKLSEQITERARQITQTVQHSSELTDQGREVLQTTVIGINQIRAQVQTIGGNIQMLARLTRRIDEIITSVSEIATQSNLLALNASIEAARAGTHGRGFAVVADEVRSLSQQSTGAAEQVREILAEIREAVRRTVEATEIGVTGAEQGVDKARETEITIKQLADNVTDTNQAIQAIYEAIREQSTGLEEVAIGVERIERITNQYISSTDVVKTVSTNLSRLAEDLQTVMRSGGQMEAQAQD